MNLNSDLAPGWDRGSGVAVSHPFGPPPILGCGLAVAWQPATLLPLTTRELSLRAAAAAAAKRSLWRRNRSFSDFKALRLVLTDIMRMKKIRNFFGISLMVLKEATNLSDLQPANVNEKKDDFRP